MDIIQDMSWQDEIVNGTTAGGGLVRKERCSPMYLCIVAVDWIITFSLICFLWSLFHSIPIINYYHFTTLPWPPDKVSMQCTDVQSWYHMFDYFNLLIRASSMLRLSWTFGSTWVDRLRPSLLARCKRSFCFRYSVRALGLWQYGWYVVSRAWEISQAY